MQSFLKGFYKKADLASDATASGSLPLAAAGLGTLLGGYSDSGAAMALLATSGALPLLAVGSALGLLKTRNEAQQQEQ